MALAARLFEKVVIELSIGTEIWLAVSSEESVECENLMIATGVSCTEEGDDDCAFLLVCDAGVAAGKVVAGKLEEDDIVAALTAAADVVCTWIPPDEDLVPPVAPPPETIGFFTPAASEHRIDPILTGSCDIFVPGKILLNTSPNGLLPA